MADTGELVHTRCWDKVASDQLQQRGFAGAIGPNKRDAGVKIDAVVNVFVQQVTTRVPETQALKAATAAATTRAAHRDRGTGGNRGGGTGRRQNTVTTECGRAGNDSLSEADE